MAEVEENCGVCVASELPDVYFTIKALQHRGREAAGIAAISEERIDVLKWTGTVDAFDLKDLHKIFPNHHYHTYMAHVRYATSGRKEPDQILEDAHPHVIGGKVEHRGNHVLILDCDAALIHNGQVSEKYLKEVDKTKLKTGSDSEAFLHYYMEKGESEVLKNIPGSYLVAIADKRKKGVVVLRDRHGIKPGCLFMKGNRFGIASESVGAEADYGEVIGDLQMGAAYYLFPDAKRPIPQQIIKADPKHCFFEWNYVAHINSILDGLSVRRLREELGREIAKEFKFDVDMVSYIPRCPEVAARTCAIALEKEKEIPMFYKLRGDRSFLESTLDARAKSIKKNLFLISGIRKKLEGKKVLVIDDSFVRGNVLNRISELIEETEVEKVHILSYTPPIGIIGEDGIKRGCSCGVDMPPDDKFLIRNKSGTKNRSIEEISSSYGKRIQVHYLSEKGMFKAYKRLGMSRKNLENFCIGGDVPFIMN